MKNIVIILLVIISFGSGLMVGSIKRVGNPDDLNHNGVVDVRDLSIFLKNYKTN